MIQNTLGGILIWIAIQAEKDNDGNRDMRIQRLLSKSQRTFDRIHQGSLLQYCHDVESVYEELGELDVEMDEDINLLGNLERVDSTEAKFLTHNFIEKFSTLDECVTHLKLYSSQDTFTFQDQ